MTAALVATACAVTTGDSAQQVDSASDAPASAPSTDTSALMAERAAERAVEGSGAGFGVSRSAARPSLEGMAAVSPDREGAEAGVGGAARVEPPSDPRDIARAMLARHGWSGSEFGCLDDLWVSESNWDPLAENPTSGAYGIPQALPAEKLASAGSDWQTNPQTQIEWGLGYIAARYGSPCSANSFKLSNGWY